MEGRRSRAFPEIMTRNAADDADERVADAEESDRYAELSIGDEEFVIYDRKNHRAWIQSTVAVTVADRR